MAILLEPNKKEPKELFDYHIEDVDLGYEREKMFIRHFIKLNAFPDYETATKIILEDEQIACEMYAEYGELNHRLMLEAYENFDDEDKLRKIGVIINRRGDHRTMAMNSYALNRVCNYIIQQSDIKYSYYERQLVSSINRHYLNYAWDCVGTWRC